MLLVLYILYVCILSLLYDLYLFLYYLVICVLYLTDCLVVMTDTKQLEAIADRLVKTKAKLLYLMTTPMMPECCAGAALLPSGEGAPVPKCTAGAAATYRCDSVVRPQARCCRCLWSIGLF